MFNRLSPEITIFSGVQIATMVVARALAKKTRMAANRMAAILRKSIPLVGAGRILVEHLVLDVRPEFLQHLRNRVRRHLRQQLGYVIGYIALIRMIRIGNRHADRVAAPLGIVEPRTAR